MWEAQYDKKMLRQFFINIERREENSALAKKLSAKRIIDLYKFYKARKIYYDKLKVIRENNNLKKKKKASSIRRRSSIYSIKSNFDYSKRASIRKNRRSSQYSNNDFLRANIKKHSNASSINTDFKINLINMESSNIQKVDKDIHDSSVNSSNINQSNISKKSDDSKINENS